MSRFTGWMDQLTCAGKLRAGQPLADESRVVTGRRTRAVADGPFAEAKEAVGGYLLLAVGDLDEATTLAEECPLMDYGASVEVRPIIERCAAMEHVGLELTAIGAVG